MQHKQPDSYTTDHNPAPPKSTKTVNVDLKFKGRLPAMPIDTLETTSSDPAEAEKTAKAAGSEASEPAGSEPAQTTESLPFTLLLAGIAAAVGFLIYGVFLAS